MKQSTLFVWVGLLAGSATAVVSATENEMTMQALQLTRMVQPTFPSQLAVHGVPSGDVTLAVSRDAAGTPTDILVIESSHSLFSEAAVEAVREWRFAPIDKSVVASTAPAVVRVSFSFQGVIYVYPTIANQQRGRSSNEIRSRTFRVPTLEMTGVSPQPVNYQEPAYPAELAAQGRQGEAKVVFYVDGEGKVRMPRVLSATAPEFGAAALAAVSAWRFEPPKQHGNAVVAADSWTFQFKGKS